MPQPDYFYGKTERHHTIISLCIKHFVQSQTEGSLLQDNKNILVWPHLRYVMGWDGYDK